MPVSYFSRLRTASQHQIASCSNGKGGLQDLVEVLTGQEKLVFGNSKLFHSVPFFLLTDLNILLRPHIVARLDSLFNRKRNLFVGALSRTFSIPSVSGPAFQVCGYHIDRLSESTHLPRVCDTQRICMTASGFKSVFGDCIVDNLISRHSWHTVIKDNASTFYFGKGIDRCTAARMSLKNQDRSNHAPIYGYFMYNAVKAKYMSDLFSWSGWNDLHSSSASSLSAQTSPDVSFDSSSCKDQVPSTTASSEQKDLPDRTLKLLSGSCYLPHPDKEETGGEDAHFICAEEQAIGVADGVGGWADLGIDAGKYARELMSNSVNAIQEEPKGYIDPARVLEKAHSNTKEKGSSTACIIALTNQGGLHAINLGDSGFIVVRDGCTVFQSPVQQHDFNFTYQLECGTGGDLPSSGQVFTIPVAPGDVIIAGTDGLFDNLYNNEVTAVVVHAMRAGLGPRVTAQRIAELARQRAQDAHRQTPFSIAAQDAGFHYYGGKLDDITVVVSYITSSGNGNDSTC
ncbi:hypothetical protein Nepgr_019351 [Nepenthes gracilis]|uniref:Protein phosphatase n=1 Tax=Nepenthes gracilis TaxID=150966 RepID=A0AAD3STD9_NEPGR|nr:hypothetical protein Nepgr_019351 [Nepenthes gracilis]